VSDQYNHDDYQTQKLPAPRKGDGRMSDEELARIVHGVLDDAEQLVDGVLSQERVKATRYYKGEPFGNEEDGRSQFIATELRDAVRGVLPDLVRPFFAADRPVEYVPRLTRGVADPQAIMLSVAKAKQATDYARYVFEEQGGFLKTIDVLMDALVRKVGIFTWYWDEERAQAYEEQGLSYEEAYQIAERDDVTMTRSYEHKDGTWDVSYTVKIEGKPCITTLAPEELLFTRGARDPEQAQMLGHRTLKTRGELIAMNISKADIDEHGGANEDPLDTNVETQERNKSTNVFGRPQVEAGKANDYILYCETYQYLDVDGDGIAELRRICTIGSNHYPVVNEPADERPYAIGCLIPEAHELIGSSFADLTMDLQLVKSSVVRSMLDSLALSIFPRVAFVEDLVNVEDLLDNTIGAPIRMRKEGAATPFTHPFTGEAAFPMLEFFDSTMEGRVGRDKGSMGLDADALQSSTKTAVTAAVQASQGQMELMARIFAEQVYKPLFLGIYKMLKKYRPQARLVKLRGSYIPIDVAEWDADVDVSINVALGSSDIDRRRQSLIDIKTTQESILANYGPQNPICTVAQYRETLARLAELDGNRDVSAFYSEVDPNWQPPQQQPQPTPEQTIAQANIQIAREKNQKDLEIKQAELLMKQEQQKFTQQIEIRKAANDFVLRRYQIDAQFHTSFTQMNLEADARSEEAALEGALNVAGMAHDHAVAGREQDRADQGQAHEQALAVDAQGHDQQMAEQAAAQPATPTEQ
jgi:hypothetical protein